MVEYYNNVLINQGKKCDLNCRRSIERHRIVTKEKGSLSARLERSIKSGVVYMAETSTDLYLVEQYDARRGVEWNSIKAITIFSLHKGIGFE